MQIWDKNANLIWWICYMYFTLIHKPFFFLPVHSNPEFYPHRESKRTLQINKMGFGLILLLILYIIWDFNYFIRCVFTVALGRLFQRKRKINETTSIYGKWFAFHSLIRMVMWFQIFFQHIPSISSFRSTKTSTGLCTTQDVDIFIRHMNNARYVRELDFARFHFYALTGKLSSSTMNIQIDSIWPQLSVQFNLIWTYCCCASTYQ